MAREGTWLALAAHGCQNDIRTQGSHYRPGYQWPQLHTPPSHRGSWHPSRKGTPQVLENTVYLVRQQQWVAELWSLSHLDSQLWPYPKNKDHCFSPCPLASLCFSLKQWTLQADKFLFPAPLFYGWKWKCAMWIPLLPLIPLLGSAPPTWSWCYPWI